MAVADTGEYTLSMKRGEEEETRKEERRRRGDQKKRGMGGGAVNNITEQQCYKRNYPCSSTLK